MEIVKLQHILSIGSGGFAGAILRYLVGGWVQRLSGSPVFPVGTLTVNLIGCFLIGIGYGLVEQRSVFTPEIRSFFFIGFLGSFTTFSTFGYETFILARDVRVLGSLANVGLHIIIGLVAVWCGNIVSKLL